MENELIRIVAHLVPVGMDCANGRSHESPLHTTENYMNMEIKGNPAFPYIPKQFNFNSLAMNYLYPTGLALRTSPKLKRRFWGSAASTTQATLSPTFAFCPTGIFD